PGLKWPPAELNGGSHLPTAWTWNACSPAGRPLTTSFNSTPAGDWMSSAVPTTLPSASLRDALAVCAAAGAMAASAAIKLAAPTCEEKRDILVMRWASGCGLLLRTRCICPRNTLDWLLVPAPIAPPRHLVVMGPY